MLMAYALMNHYDHEEREVYDHLSLWWAPLARKTAIGLGLWVGQNHAIPEYEDVKAFYEYVQIQREQNRVRRQAEYERWERLRREAEALEDKRIYK